MSTLRPGPNESRPTVRTHSSAIRWVSAAPPVQQMTRFFGWLSMRASAAATASFTSGGSTFSVRDGAAATSISPWMMMSSARSEDSRFGRNEPPPGIERGSAAASTA